MEQLHIAYNVLISHDSVKLHNNNVIIEDGIMQTQ